MRAVQNSVSTGETVKPLWYVSKIYFTFVVETGNDVGGPSVISTQMRLSPRYKLGVGQRSAVDSAPRFQALPRPTLPVAGLEGRGRVISWKRGCG